MRITGDTILEKVKGGEVDVAIPNRGNYLAIRIVRQIIRVFVYLYICVSALYANCLRSI